MHARRIRHVLIHDLADAKRRMLGCKIQWRSDPLGCRAPGTRRVQTHFTARKGGWIDATEHQIRIGYCRFRAALSITYGSRVRPRAVRPDDDPPESVNA